MPKGELYGTRSKLIHTVGSMGEVTWTSTGNHPYTGLFKGSDKCFARMSLAGEPDTKKLTTAPGMGFKCVRDGIDSGNFVAMYATDGQESWNFFENEFKNHIHQSSPALTATVGATFSRVTKFIGAVGLSDFSRYGVDGRKENNEVFPFQLAFRPTSEVPQFPTEYSGMSHTDMLATVTKGTVLYDIYAQNKPEEQGGNWSKIGKLTLDEKFTTSKWGDAGYFIRHQMMDDDLKIHPEWVANTSRFGLTGSEAQNTCSIEKAPLDSKCPW